MAKAAKIVKEVVDMTATVWVDGFGNFHALVPSVWDEEAAKAAIAVALLERGLTTQQATEDALWAEFVELGQDGAVFREAWRWPDDED